MPDAVTTQTIVDGSRKVVMKFTNYSDSTGESTITKVDVSSLAPEASEVKISKVWFSTGGMAVNILWEATADVIALTVPADQTNSFDFRPVGGLTNNAGAGVTGDILFTTVGAAAGDSYMIILEMDKV